MKRVGRPKSIRVKQMPGLKQKKCFAAVGLLLLLAGCGGQSNDHVIKIGFAGPLTGDQAPQGQDMLHGAQLAVEQANAKGEVISGYRFELVQMDDQRSPTQAVAVAKKLVADNDVVAVVGHLNSSCTQSASEIYYQARMLSISPVSSNPKLSRRGFDTFYRTCATDDQQGPAAALFAVRELAAKRVFIIDDRTTYGLGLANELKTKLVELGAEVIGHEGITQGDKDFVPLLTKIKSQSPDLVYFAGMFPEGALLVKQRAEIGLGGRFMAGDGCFDPVLIKLAGPEAAQGVYLTTIGSDIHTIPTAKEFLTAYEPKYGPVGAYSSYAYEAANIVIWAIQKAGKKDRVAVLVAMKELKDYPGIFGAQNFDEHGDSRIKDIGIFTVKDGKFAFVKTAQWE